ncbi:hypothetical protein AKJ09_07130 [Labilithrix luteola]|uniref:Uncharacterized protein n=1 Tax=Labilithrix luteola TaxID=1391654 RepID=A0A0K1Q494_9BACT|nr:hypothetical protein AKJ09_07130 [Labilithrix luteola]
MIGTRERFQKKRIICADGDCNSVVRTRDGGGIIIDTPAIWSVRSRVAFSTAIRE